MRKDRERSIPWTLIAAVAVLAVVVEALVFVAVNQMFDCNILEEW